jgi:phage terminase large subunit
MKITIDPSAYSSAFHKTLYSWDRYIIEWGGRGSSKTDTFYLKYLISLFEPYYFKLAYVNKFASDIRDKQYAGFKRVAKRIGLDSQLRFYDGDYRIVNPKTGNMLIPKGMDDPEKTKGLDDITAIWWDEINLGTVEDFRALNELLRSPMARYLQFAMSFNPVHINHWLRHTFFHPDDSHKLHPDFVGQAYLHHSTYKDNEFIDRKEYLNTLVTSAAGNANTLRVNVDGDWGLEVNNDPWLYALKPEVHLVDDLPFLPSFPLYLSFDFNRSPLTCSATQMSPSKGMKDSFCHTIYEFVGDVQLEDLCRRIRAKYPSSIFFVTGDASGRAGDVAFEARHSTYYTMIQRYLNLADKQMHINTRNLEHNDSRQICNMMLHSYPNIRISRKGCPVLCNDMQIATVDDKKAAPGVLKKDRDQFKMDMLDNWRYMVQTYYLEYCEKVFAKLA